MFKTIFNFFFPSSVSGVMGSFQKTVDNLNKVSVRNAVKAEKARAKSDDLYAKAEDELAKADHKAEAAYTEALDKNGAKFEATVGKSEDHYRKAEAHDAESVAAAALAARISKTFGLTE
ncbi:MAG: hypothetical protein B7Y48_07645 [Methylophilales bacterium 28-44-11]|nr:MAG: hypothetical protein B7Y48_07645 [Methylophilales bacterium 28-44-11]